MKEIHPTENHIKQDDYFYHTIAESSFAGIYVVQNGRFSYLNRNAASYAGYTPIELVGRDAFSIVNHEDRDLVNKLAREMLKGLRTEPYEFRIITKDWQTRWIMETVTAITYQGKPAILGNSMDVTDVKKTEQALKASEERYRRIIENIGDGYYEVDLKGTIQFINDACARITGVPRHKLMGMSFKDFAFEGELADLYNIFSRVFMTGEPEKGLVNRVKRPDGKDLYVEISVSLKKDSKGKPNGFMGIMHDVTDRKRAEETIQWMAYHDALTGLPNRILFHDRLVLALTQAKRNNEKLAVMMMDLDKFKEINDSYGHYMGDCILCAFVERLKKQLREGDTVARTGGDEFMTLLPGINQLGDAKKLGTKIIAALRAPVEVGEQSFTIRASIGIALYPRDGEDFDTLVNKADTAMYQAKNHGGNTSVVYDGGSNEPKKS